MRTDPISCFCSEIGVIDNTDVLKTEKSWNSEFECGAIWAVSAINDGRRLDAYPAIAQTAVGIGRRQPSVRANDRQI